ncbi:MAG: slipin family protein, partial [Actinobacteria bacterium]|nr:slipin family protein [Actinomycetota bacterium]
RIMSGAPAAIQLRYLQTLREIATEQNSTILFPIPMDLIGAVIEKLTK